MKDKKKIRESIQEVQYLIIRSSRKGENSCEETIKHITQINFPELKYMNLQIEGTCQLPAQGVKIVSHAGML